MKSPDPLHLLIQHLSQTEKRYFKRFSQLHGTKDSNYLLLFDAIDRMTVYSESGLRGKLKGKTLLKHLSSEKNYLYHLILKSLRAYHADGSKNNELYNLMQSIEILFEKGLYKQCEKLVQKAKKIAYTYEKNTLLLDVLAWEQKITRARFDLENLDETITEENRIIGELQQVVSLKIIFYRLTTFIDQRGVARSKEELQRLDEIIRKDILQKERPGWSYEAGVYYYMAWSDYYYAHGNLEKDYEYSRKLLQFVTSYPQLLVQDVRVHVNALSYFIIACLRLKRFDEAHHTLGQLKAYLPGLRKLTRDMEVRTYSLCVRLELNYFRLTGQFEKGATLVQEVSSALSTKQRPLSKEQELVIGFFLAFFYWQAGNRKQTLHWINHILSQKLREDILCFTRILNLIFHYEQGNEMILDHNIRSTKSYLKRKKKLFNTEIILLKYLEKLAEHEDQRDKLWPALFKQMKENLTNPYERTILDYFDLLAWIESKIEHKTLEEVVRERLVRK
ncbi:MAG: hypothetical protein H6585_11090 [Flavobacteriales bacterium]|nr:hypothetical protein [Flavobacteriales bacterium]MCB9448879.1 hypothetical protein [Flavobacteriales bacterium]